MFNYFLKNFRWSLENFLSFLFSDRFFPSIYKKVLFFFTFTFILSTFLFYVMARLISSDHDLSQLKSDNEIIEFSMSQHKSRLFEKKRKLPEKKKEVKPPEFKPLQPVDSKLLSDDFNFDMSNFLDSFNLGGGLGSSGVTPIIRIAPQYPPSAAIKGIEGWVILQFDITSSGTTSNIRVLKALPPRIFNKVAVEALSKWKYKPKMENNKPVVRKNNKIQLDFVLEK